MKYVDHKDRLLKKVPVAVNRAKDDALVSVRAHAPKRTGKYRASLRADVTNSASQWKVVIGSPLRSGRLHEKGGVIRARRGDFLVFNAGSGVRKVTDVRYPATPHLAPVTREWSRMVSKRMSEVVGR